MAGADNPRRLAVLALTRLEKRGGFLKEALHFQLQKSALAAQDKALLTELAYGTVRLRKNLDYVLSTYSKRPLAKIKPELLNNLRLGAYQILYLDRVPAAAAVNEAVKLAHTFGHRGTANFTNAVLRRVAREKDNITYPELAARPLDHIAFKYSFPRWIIELWLEWLGEDETIELCKALNQPPQTTVRVNTLKTSVSEVTAHLKSKGALVEPGSFAPEILYIKPGNAAVNDEWLSLGMYYIQDESSALAAHALRAEPGQVVYDLCSAPGGKATHLAQLMNNEGRIFAFDLAEKRLRLVLENARRLGIGIIEAKQGDASLPLGLSPAPRVLVDAPCSGLGTMRHRPDIRWRKTLKEVKALVKLQRAILRQAAEYVDRGGLLVYATCTITKEENLDVANWFLKTHTQFSPAGLPAWFPKRAGEPPWYVQILPHRHGMDGFFIAAFQKE
ncbi:MAG TPA: 16S rRNA (cytosine(967)-C(5))-methyltransferase RsmB [Firmicutes bacterium]|nr:16S rRNA (cytosine(967)-C(5))-methyltransferase RsmB [Bacillota bacterium]